MRMPQDFLDAINAAVREVNPQAGITTHGDMFLGSDFDEWLGPGAIKKYGFGQMPPEAVAAFEAKFAERRAELKASLVASAVDVEKRRIAGETFDLDFDDSHHGPKSRQQQRDVREIVAELTRGDQQGSSGK